MDGLREALTDTLRPIYASYIEKASQSANFRPGLLATATTECAHAVLQVFGYSSAQIKNINSVAGKSLVDFEFLWLASRTPDPRSQPEATAQAIVQALPDFPYDIRSALYSPAGFCMTGERQQLERALQRGKPVNPVTLCKYPDLIATYGMG